MQTISLQPGQPGNGMDYDPAVPLPYPIHMDEDGLCWNVPGHALRDGDPDDRPRLVGFQPTGPDPDPSGGMLLRDEWIDTGIEGCVGWWPVFAHKGGMFNLTEPITNVSVEEIASR
jgi:hypothetical protein